MYVMEELAVTGKAADAVIGKSDAGANADVGGVIGDADAGEISADLE